jgi:ribosomal protein S18 acetylase RimI-like enzyme
VTTTYRPFRNTDPPALVGVWNAAATGRGAYPLRSPATFERWILSKTYFENPALTVAERDGELVGFSLAGFGPNADESAADKSNGVICTVLVKPEVRKDGVGQQLLQHAEKYLTDRGATTLRVGAQKPNNPYLFGLYGGSNSPGILDSDAGAKEFLTAAGYTPGTEVLVFQRQLDKPIDVADPRFNLLRKRYDVQLLRSAVVGSWWQECVWGGLEPAEFRAVDKLTGLPAARATAWELEGFGWKWNHPSAGIIDVQVRDDLRRQGMAKFLVTHILRFLQDQFFGIAELQVFAASESGAGLCKSVGFELVDTGREYVKAVGGG